MSDVSRALAQIAVRIQQHADEGLLVSADAVRLEARRLNAQAEMIDLELTEAVGEVVE